MGLSLQLLIHLSKLLEQHGVSSDPNYAQALVERLRERFPGLVGGIDPDNHHTPIASAVALAIALNEDSGKDPVQDLALANALEWVMKKQVDAKLGHTATTDEQAALDWARHVLDRQLQQAEDEEATLWRPEAHDLTMPAPVPQIDPMLLPDVPVQKMAKFLQEHGMGEGRGSQGGAEASMPGMAILQSESVDDPQGQATENHASGGDGLEAGIEPGRAIEEAVKLERRWHFDWQMGAWIVMGLLFPPAGLLAGGYYMGSGRKWAGSGIAIAGFLGWLVNRIFFG